MSFSNYTGNLVGGGNKLYSNLTTAKTSSQSKETTNSYTVIVELYMEQVNAYTAIGLRRTGSSIAHSSYKE